MRVSTRTFQCALILMVCVCVCSRLERQGWDGFPLPAVMNECYGAPQSADLLLAMTTLAVILVGYLLLNVAGGWVPWN